MSSLVKACICVLILVGAVFAQTDRGTITGTVTDPAGAVVAGAAIKAKNTATGVEYPAMTTNTGYYTLAQLPVGPYELSVSISGFKNFSRTGITVLAAQTLRIDVGLEVGSISETVTVNADASLLKTESGELSHNVQTESLNSLPILGIGSGVGLTGMRNPYAAMQLLPGADWIADGSVKVNGAPSNTQGMLVEGMDATTNMQQMMAQYGQMGVDAIQEMAVQTSNYAPEFGTAGTAVFNVTMKSGTNTIHGSAYEYFVNEALNAGTPFTEDGTGGHLRPRSRRNDFGFTFGGPVYLPRIYDGRDKLFFFFNFEEYRQTSTANSYVTVPTAAMRNGDFQAVKGTSPLRDSTGNVITDIVGRPVYANTIYDPNTEHLSNGVRVWDPFPNNIIPPGRQRDVAALAIQSYMPQPSGPNASASINNALVTYPNANISYVPSVKADYSISPKAKISGFWSMNSAYTVHMPDGLPKPITATMPIKNVAQTVRINFDYTIGSSMMLHLGAGLIQNILDYQNGGKTPQTDLKIPGGDDATPLISGLFSGAYGGYSPMMGAVMQSRFANLKPTANPSLSWIKGNHSYKFGAGLIVESYPGTSKTNANNFYTFNAAQTADPSLILTNTILPSGQSIGFPYASFLLGGYAQGQTAAVARGHMGSHAISFFAQDSWKITPKITLDYGLRYDFQTYLKEQYGRMGSWSPTAWNPKVGRPGAIQYEGYWPGHCQCDYAENYPYAFGPRLGLAWQLAPKTVLRAGAGVSYNRTSEFGYISNWMSNQVTYSSQAASSPIGQLSTGVPPQYVVTWPSTDQGAFPHLPSLDAPLVANDHNAGRPARIFQWSFGIQREITKNLLLDISYVGNRGAWWYAGVLTDVNALTPEYLQSKYGLDIKSASDRALLASPLSSVQAKGPSYAARFPTPFAGFPMASTLAQAISPFPQSTGINILYAPLGRTWYDSLQLNLTKRFSHSFSFNYSFTWQKELTMAAESSYFFTGAVPARVNDSETRSVNKYLSGLSRPFMSVLSVSYTTPKLFSNKLMSSIARDWQFNALLRYSSAYPIKVPAASSNIETLLHRNPSNTPNTYPNRVSGQPIFSDSNGNPLDPNCHCFDPSTTFVLNPNAWTEPAPGTFGTSTAYWNDYRGFRHPQENMGLARSFRFGRDGRMNLSLRAEFNNIFNRLYLANPTATSYLATQTRNAKGQTSGGFGYINVNDASTATNVRSGQIVARLSF